MIPPLKKYTDNIARVVEGIEAELYQYTVRSELQPFEAKVRLNLRLTWLFLVAGLAYAASFIAIGHYFVVIFAAAISVSFILIPFTIRFQFERLRRVLYLAFVIFFISINLFGAGNTTSIPVVCGWFLLFS